MHTIEAAYVMGVVLLVLLGIVNGGVQLHNTVVSGIRQELQAEISSHSKDGEKEFRPEEFMRMATLFQKEEEQNEQTD